MDYLAGPLIAGGMAVVIFGGGYFLFALVYFTVTGIVKRIARKARARRILQREADRWNDGNL